MPHERGVVDHAGFQHQLERDAREAVGGRAEARRLAARGLLDRLDRAAEPGAVLGVGELVRVLVHVAVMRDLVPVGEDALRQLLVGLEAPGRHEEGLP